MSQEFFGQFREGALGPFRLGNFAGLTLKIGKITKQTT